MAVAHVVLHGVLSSDGWTEAAAVGAIVAAIATVILAGVTARLARETKCLAMEAQAATKATKKEADATLNLGKNAALDRELAWRPWVTSVSPKARTGDGSYQALGVEIRNVGSGPALRTIFVGRHDDDRWCVLGPLDIGSRESVGPMDSRGVGNPLPPGLFPETPAGSRRTSAIVLCSDIFGNRYRFTFGGSQEEPDIWRVEDPPPTWASWRY